VPDAAPTFLTGSALELGLAEPGFLPYGLTFGLTPSTNAATPSGLPDQEAKAMGNMAQNQGAPDGVSRSAPQSPTDTLIALAAAGRNPTDITLPTAGSEGSGGGDEDAVVGGTGSASTGSSTSSGSPTSGSSGSSSSASSPPHAQPEADGPAATGSHEAPLNDADIGGLQMLGIDQAWIDDAVNSGVPAQLVFEVASGKWRKSRTLSSPSS
jgi:hypothetical protein